MEIGGVNRIGPMLKWGFSGLFAGVVAGAATYVYRAPGFPDHPSADAAKFGGAVGGAFGLIGGLLVVFMMILFDRMRYDIQKRSAAERKDPTVVPQLYQDVSDGYVTDA